MRRAPWTGAIFPPGSRGGPSERLVRVALAVVLLAAAGLKMASLVGGGLLSGQAAVTGVLSLVEGLVALWLAWGGVGAVWAALILFGAFAGYSLRGALAGRATCGCFGPVAVPLWGALAMDGAAMGLLAASGGGRRWPARLGLGCLAAGSVWLLPPSLLPLENDAGWLRPARQERLLDLSATVGQRFPLLERIDIGRELATGRWRVLLYRRDCPQCRRHLDALRDHDLQAEGLRLALVALPSAHGTPPVDRCADCRQGRLDLPGGWVLATPWDVTLQDGIVVSARSPENLNAAQAGL